MLPASNTRAQRSERAVHSILGAVALAVLSLGAQAQSPRPALPQLMPASFKAMADRAGYAAFLAEACSFPAQIPARFKKLVAQAELGEDRQMAHLTSFRQAKSMHASNSNVLGVTKRCYIDAAKSKSLISDVEIEIDEMTAMVEKKRRDYELALASWEREQRELGERREQEARTAQESADRRVRDAHQANADRHSEQLGRLIVAARYDGGSNIGVALKDWNYNPADKSLNMRVEIRWSGKFTGKSYGADGTIKAIYDGSSSWTWEPGKNYFWNPSWHSSTLEAYIRCAKTLFGTCD